ncbi:MAG TPA: translocation/assembly module TamB domain-containing protein [Chitinophagaceae bacterium]|nr:translocation/assembly module TamB domain-containing protein [Chitinophagaceae bacterium]
MKKFWKITRFVLLGILLLIVFAWLAIQTTPVQNWLAKKVTSRLSRDLNTNISIKKVDFALFNKMLLEGTLVEDRNRDTLLYAGTVEVRITDWFFFKDNIELKYIGLKNAQINFQRTDSIWNYQFLVDYFSSPTKARNKKRIEYNFRVIDLENVSLVKKDGWEGENQVVKIGALKMDPEQVDFNKKIAYVKTLSITRPEFFLYKYRGNRAPRPASNTEPAAIVNDPNNLRWNADGWDIVINELTIDEGTFKNDRFTERKPYTWFDGQHMLFSNITGSFKNLRLHHDTLTADIQIKAKERSGLDVKNFTAKVTMHPELMAFDNLDLRTNHSRLTNYFAMRYNSFQDMGRFLTDVRLEANFANSEINSDDIAIFAPAMKDWDKIIRLQGQAKGSIDNLSARNFIAQAGNNTFLNGDFHIAGLPDINQAFIDFKANEFKTTYGDAVRLIPSLRNVNVPDLSKIEYLRFRGNFTGFIKDFVTYGTIETNLGVISSDLNMKLNRAQPVYSGNISTSNFRLGAFLDNPQFGNLSFKGHIKGSGFALSVLDASLQGTVQELGFRDYTYKNVEINGTFTKKLFNGKFVSKDPNLLVSLDGLIDLNQEKPRFDFTATVDKANLQRLNLYNKDIDFNGKFRVDFTGTNIDDFMGTARIYEASLYNQGKRFSFDSLILESKIMDNNKTLTVVSNEFDGAIAGEFSIRELPASFQTFLHRYYPTYIKPARFTPENENFSFVITTKKVDEYLNLIDPSIQGFNFSTISGRINSKENLLDLNAEIPQFNYKNISFYNTSLKGRGNLDSLIMETTFGDVYINDSLHFPQTYVRVSSANDWSQVRIKTSASQTLNSADIAARVQTLPHGARIYFDPSTFEVNAKQWQIAKDGELVLSKEIVSADGVRIFSGDQEVVVTTIPSATGNTNDIQVTLKKINLGDFTPFLVKSNRIEGLFTGTIDVVDPFGKMQVSLEGEAEQFRLDNDSIGRIVTSGNYTQRTGQINFKALSENKNFNFDIQGMLAQADSTGNRQMDFNANFKNTNINLISRYLSGIFSDVSGYATGNLRITGLTNKMKWLGKLQLNDARLKVNYTQVHYNIPSAIIDFKDGYIDFGSITIRDDLQNSAQISRAKLYHTGFKDMGFDFAINTNRLLLLNTTAKDNSQFYGKVIGNASFTLTGPQDNMRMDIQGEPVDSSSIYLPTSSVGRESAEADFIVWKVYGKEMQEVLRPKETNLTVTLDITANNYVDAYVILDELTGDIIKANGHGNLEIRAGTNEDFTIVGRYNIDRGNYLFTFQSFLRKPFTLIEGAGNYIQWTGNPYEATIKLDARYEAENVRFSDLNLTGANIQVSSQNLLRYRGSVFVVASLTGNLMKPEISFEIELPQGSPLRNDQEAQFVLQRIQSDQNELNKQVSFLLVFNSFGPLSNTGTGNLVTRGFESIVVNSISGFISNQISKQLSRAFEKAGVKVNFNAELYSGSNFLNEGANNLSLDRTKLDLSFAKSLLNERLTFTFGSALDFGLNTQQVQAARTQFLPDLSAEWKIRPDGRLLLTFFYRDSWDYVINSRQNRSGVSISHRREFDTLGELFRRKKKKNIAPPPVVKDSVQTVSGTN